MDEQNQIVCPECRTAQAGRAPFCENCGYRFRAGEAGGSGAASPGSVAASAQEIVARARKKVSQSRQDNLATVALPALAQQEGHEGGAARVAVSAGAAQPPAEQPVPRASGPSTYVEGLRAVDVSAARPAESTQTAPQGVEAVAGGAQASVAGGSAGRGAPGDQTTSFAIPRPNRMPIYIALWLSLSALGVLATYVVATRVTQAAPAAAARVDLSTPLQVPAGSFARGLDESVRSFIMQMCQRVDEEPDINCVHDTLFKGEFPQKTVHLDAFHIDAGEVTVAAFQQCVSKGKCAPIDYKACQVWTHLGLQVALRVPRALQQDEMAVTCVDWSQARDYCEFVGGQLPTADQWEKAARGEDARLFPWGNTWGSDLANWAERDMVNGPIAGKLDGFALVAPPGSFPDGKSPYGAYDMAGNVAEWVASDDPRKALTRGGAWTDSPFELRASAQRTLDARVARTDVGFRCAYP